MLNDCSVTETGTKDQKMSHILNCLELVLTFNFLSPRQYKSMKS